MELLQFFNLDIEPTNRCNAKCSFCPRDQTPHQGLMTQATFDQSLVRASEFRIVAQERFDRDIKVNLCGLGEPLLNTLTPGFVHQVRSLGLDCSLSSNAALLDERRATDLLDAGLQAIEINVGDIDDQYEEIYQLPFERTRDNILRFKEMAEGRCNVRIVLVDHRRDPVHTEAVANYWRSHGIDQFFPFKIMNRAGALQVDSMQYNGSPDQAQAADMLREAQVRPICAVPFVFLFVGYDGQYYLCCSDWKKEVPLGSVFDASFVDVAEAKLRHVTSRRPICHACNHDPVNSIADELGAVREGLTTELEKDIHFHTLVGYAKVVDVLVKAQVDAEVDAAISAFPSGPEVNGRRSLIPLRTL